MLRGLHAVLLEGVRGKDKTPGQFRTVQNWIGPEGCAIEGAVFVPPVPAAVLDSMELWSAYYGSQQPDPLVQLAVVHAQFEIIHPFTDGNGRIGRILIPLFLFEKQLLRRPMFYLSAWFERRRDEYVGRLRALGGDVEAWNAWCEFFLRGIQEQAVQNAQTARAIIDLYERLKNRSINLTHSRYAVPLLDFAFRQPVFKTPDLEFADHTPSKPTVAGLLNALVDGKVLKVLRPGRGRRPTIYALAELINLCEGKQVV
jgi:Fic family protein